MSGNNGRRGGGGGGETTTFDVVRVELIALACKSSIFIGLSEAGVCTHNTHTERVRERETHSYLHNCICI